MPKIEYTLPDFTANLGLNLFFVRLFMDRPSWMQENVKVASIYGCFPGCKMNGGRSYLREQTPVTQIDRTFSILQEYGLVPRLTFTNMLATPADLDDDYTRSILETATRYNGEVIVYNDEVGQAIRERYGMPLVLSTTRALLTPEEVNAAAETYDWVVLNYNYHKDAEFLAALAHPEKAEVMVNEFCVAHCPHRQEHYLVNSQDQHEGVQHPFQCVAHKADFFKHESGHPVIFTADEVARLHDDYGINSFKIVGRGVPFETVLESLAYYLVRPEYRAQVKQLVHAQTRR